MEDNDCIGIGSTQGYLNGTDTYQTYYLMVRSSGGGSSTLPFNLRYSASFPYDSFETDENTGSAKELAFNSGGFLINSRNISAPADSDWYKLTIPSTKNYDEITLSLNAGINNSNKAELFLDATGNNNLMLLGKITSSASNKIAVIAGTYYIRVSYNGQDSLFDNNNVDNYSLSLAPQLKATGIQITDYFSEDRDSGYVHYPQGYYYRAPGSIKFIGVVYSKDPVTGEKFAVPNAKVKVRMIDGAQDKEEYLYRNNDGLSNSQGIFEIRVSFGPGVGVYSYTNYATITYYDLVFVQVWLEDQPSIMTEGKVYHIADILH